MRPIVGLVHHGSGPRHTSLLDPSFAEGLAEFAAAVAERYPWVDGYTPVNEPLTTARFSGLYGHWYPHGRSARDCIRALANECRATILAMRAIRRVNPAAYLVQTEDLGKTHATPLLAYQAEFNNDFRWLTFDLLEGRVDRDHPLWNFLRASGLSQAELEWFGENACPPDILGLNHYLSGERFLDERIERYPEEEPGGNGRHRYVDVLAARVLESGAAGPKALFLEAWDRYHRPIAITEVHNACTREEQMRWFLDVWDAACQLRAEGVDIRAVTAWAVFGSYGWDALCTEPGGTYEIGVFDTRTSPPRPTAMVPLLKALSAGRRPAHPLLAVPGWWKRDVRFSYEHTAGVDGSVHARKQPGVTVRETVYRVSPLLALAGGSRARALLSLCRLRGIPVYRAGQDETQSGTAAADLVRRTDPWAAIVDPSLDAGPLVTACEEAGIPVAAVSEVATLDETLDGLIDVALNGDTADRYSRGSGREVARDTVPAREEKASCEHSELESLRLQL
jgi:dTDP-4-dehydrorhamnose reductase